MRVLLNQSDLEKLFSSVKRKSLLWRHIANKYSISTRTFLDWRKGKITIPYHAYKDLLMTAGLKANALEPKIVKDFWHLEEASRKGGISRNLIYGNLGTPKGRRNGGLASVIVNKKNKTNFNQLKSVSIPKNSVELAELIGIFIGDGHLSSFQASVTTNSETDKQHARFIKNLIETTFTVKVKLTNRKNRREVNLVASSKRLVAILNSKGMPIGNKISNDLNIPKWIMGNYFFKIAFIRGLFDTDGSVFIDSHRNSKKGKVYKYIGIAITSYSESLRKDILRLLKELGFNPTNSTKQMSVFLRRKDEIPSFFKIVSSSNQKHLLRYKKFLGEVA